MYIAYLIYFVNILDPLNSKPRNSKMKWDEVQAGIKGYYNEVRACVIRDRYLKNKCDPFRTENITGRVLYFLEYGNIKQSDINPKIAAGKNSIGRIQSVEDEEEERMMLEFNNSFTTSKKTSYDPSLLVGLVAVRDELALVAVKCGSE